MGKTTTLKRKKGKKVCVRAHVRIYTHISLYMCIGTRIYKKNGIQPAKEHNLK